jgi:hypothetical protein
MSICRIPPRPGSELTGTTAQSDKQGAIIDERFNGSWSPVIVDWLKRPRWQPP